MKYHFSHVVSAKVLKNNLITLIYNNVIRLFNVRHSKLVSDASGIVMEQKAVSNDGTPAKPARMPYRNTSIPLRRKIRLRIRFVPDRQIDGIRTAQISQLFYFERFRLLKGLNRGDFLYCGIVTSSVVSFELNNLPTIE